MLEEQEKAVTGDEEEDSVDREPCVMKKGIKLIVVLVLKVL